MSIIYTPKRLTMGVLPQAKTVLYTVPMSPATATTMQRVKLFNKHTSPHVCHILINGVEGEFEFWGPNVSANRGESDDEKFILNPGDVFEGYCPDGADFVNYFLFGIEKVLA